MKLRLAVKEPLDYHKQLIGDYADDFDEYYGSFVLIEPKDRPFINIKETYIQTYVLRQFNQYKLDMSLVEREQRVYVGPSFKRPDIVFYYPALERIQDNIAMIVECKNSDIPIEGDDNRAWSYVKLCMMSCHYSKYGLLTNGNISRFCIRTTNGITEVMENQFWPGVQALLGSPFWLSLDGEACQVKASNENGLKND